MPKKKKKMKFNYDTHMYKTYWPENPFSAEKMDWGGGKITIDYRPKNSKKMLNIIGTFWVPLPAFLPTKVVFPPKMRL